MSKYKVIVCRVGEAPKVEEVENPFQFTANSILGGGLVEIIHLENGVDVMLDEEGMMKDLPFNRNIPARAPEIPEGAVDFIIKADENLADPGEMGVYQIQGNFVVSRHNYRTDKPMSLTEEDIKKYMALLAHPDIIACPQCGKRRQSKEQIYCGAACSAKAEAHEKRRR